MKKTEKPKKKGCSPLGIIGGIVVAFGYFLFLQSSDRRDYSVDLMSPIVTTNEQQKITELMQAAVASDSSELKQLIQNRADVNATDYNGKTALMRAAEAGRTQNVEILIDAGADIHAKDNKEWTALMYAEWDDHTDIIKLLKAAGEK